MKNCGFKAVILVILMSLVGLNSCKNGQELAKKNRTVLLKKSNNPNNYNLNLKQNMKIELSTWSFSLTEPVEIAKQKRDLRVLDPGSVDGLSFAWQESDLDQGNQISLPNMTSTRKTLLPVFWPRGELYLSDYGGIWLSNAAFEELRQSGKTRWGLGIEDNPLLGPAQDEESIRVAIKKLNHWTHQLASLINPLTQKKFEFQNLNVLSASENYELSLNQKKVKVEVLDVGNDLFRYKILNNPQNPLILEVEFAPQLPLIAMTSQKLFLLKPLMEYHVDAIETLDD